MSASQPGGLSVPSGRTRGRKLSLISMCLYRNISLTPSSFLGLCLALCLPLSLCCSDSGFLTTPGTHCTFLLCYFLRAFLCYSVFLQANLLVSPSHFQITVPRGPTLSVYLQLCPPQGCGTCPTALFLPQIALPSPLLRIVCM